MRFPRIMVVRCFEGRLLLLLLRPARGCDEVCASACRRRQRGRRCAEGSDGHEDGVVCTASTAAAAAAPCVAAGSDVGEDGVGKGSTGDEDGVVCTRRRRRQAVVV